jgi:uncharacterized membrane protein
MAGYARNLQAFVILASVAGFGVSIYLTVVHYSSVPLVCSTTGAVDCERVLSSAYAVIAGSALPTSAAGIVFFAITGAMALSRWTGIDSSLLQRLQMGWSAIGVLVVLSLVFVEIVILGTICIWCTAAHALAVAIFVANASVAVRPAGS